VAPECIKYTIEDLVFVSADDAEMNRRHNNKQTLKLKNYIRVLLDEDAIYDTAGDDGANGSATATGFDDEINEFEITQDIRARNDRIHDAVAGEGVDASDNTNDINTIVNEAMRGLMGLDNNSEL
jgi:hypothetical protein